MGKNLTLTFIVLFASNAFGIALFSGLFDGFQNTAEYKSTIPCEATTKNACTMAQGTLGKALDKASSIGLNIQKIMIKSEKRNDNAVFVKTAQSGICYVNPNSNDQNGLKFTCSNKSLINNKLQSIDKIVVLKKNSNEDFVLEDITQKQNITR